MLTTAKILNHLVQEYSERVKDPVWRNELQFFKAEIIKKLNDKIGRTVVKDIKFY